jgi:hypothetical protein
MDDAIRPLLSKCVVPIVAQAFPEPAPGATVLVVESPIHMQFGTGTLFDVDGRKFLVTAAHVFDKAESEDYALAIVTGDHRAGGSGLIPISGNWWRTPNIADVAIVEIAADQFIGHDINFLTLDSVHTDDDIADGWFYVHGYPAVESNLSRDWATLAVTSFTCRTSLYHGSTSSLDGYNDDYHVLLSLSKSTLVHSDDDSKAKAPESLKGISGSSIWQGYSCDSVADDWCVERVKIAAVQTCTYRDDQIIRGTRWNLIAAVIAAKYPELGDFVLRYLKGRVKDWYLSSRKSKP